jgi:hypothetical protein
MFYLFLVSLIFISIAIVRNKNYEYLKQSSFAVLILTILLCLVLSRFDNGGIISIGFGEIGYEHVNLIFNLSIVVALISLIIYLFADADR